MGFVAGGTTLPANSPVQLVQDAAFPGKAGLYANFSHVSQIGSIEARADDGVTDWSTVVRGRDVTLQTVVAGNALTVLSTGEIDIGNHLYQNKGSAIQILLNAAAGTIQFNVAQDTTLSRQAAAVLSTPDSDFAVGLAGKGLRVKEGANAKQGVSAAMVAGTTTVANTAVTATSRIILTRQDGGANPGAVYVSARVAGTSFTITSTSATDTGTVAYQIFEPA